MAKQIKPYSTADIINGREAMQLLKIASRAAFKCMRERGDIPFHTRLNSHKAPYQRIYYYRSEIERLLYPAHLSNKLPSLQPQQSATFTFGDNTTIRTKVMDSRPYFVAKDVCAALDIKFYRNAIASLDEDERGWLLVNTLGGQQRMMAVNESGLYHLIFQSRKPEAKAFRKWVTAEVLPTLYRTGRYEITGNHPKPAITNDMYYTTTTKLYS